MNKPSKTSHVLVPVLVTSLKQARGELVRRICYDGERDGLSSVQIDDKISNDVTIKAINQAINQAINSKK